MAEPWPEADVKDWVTEVIPSDLPNRGQEQSDQLGVPSLSPSEWCARTKLLVWNGWRRGAGKAVSSGIAADALRWGELPAGELCSFCLGSGAGEGRERGQGS